MNHVEKARELRACTDVHFNCCQSVVVSFAQELGLSEEQAQSLGAHFGSGMRHGAVCGVLSGALMVLGGLGIEGAEAQALIRQFRERHGATNCAELLKASHDRGEARKDHCDGLVFEMVETLEQMLQERG